MAHFQVVLNPENIDYLCLFTSISHEIHTSAQNLISESGSTYICNHAFSHIKSNISKFHSKNLH
jgi:hypothetical protein